MERGLKERETHKRQSVSQSDGQRNRCMSAQTVRQIYLWPDRSRPTDGLMD